MNDQVPSKEKLPDWLRRWYALKGEPRFREAADEIERLQRANAELLKRNVTLSSSLEPPVRQCNHGAISPKGTLFYHGFVGAANHWRCDVCNCVYEGNLTEPTKQGSQLLTLVSSSQPPRPDAATVTRLPARSSYIAPISDRVDDLVRELQRQGMVTLRATFDGYNVRIDPQGSSQPPGDDLLREIRDSHEQLRYQAADRGGVYQRCSCRYCSTATKVGEQS